jgi:transcriptional regulator with XRE-family HTH domain
MTATYAVEVPTTPDYALRLGLVIRTARYIREATREQVAEGCDVSAETVARWERGDKAISAFHLSRVAEVLGLSADLLLDPPATRNETLVRIAAHDAVRARRDEPAP